MCELCLCPKSWQIERKWIWVGSKSSVFGHELPFVERCEQWPISWMFTVHKMLWGSLPSTKNLEAVSLQTYHLFRLWQQLCWIQINAMQFNSFISTYENIGFPVSWSILTWTAMNCCDVALNSATAIISILIDIDEIYTCTVYKHIYTEREWSMCAIRMCALCAWNQLDTRNVCAFQPCLQFNVARK